METLQKKEGFSHQAFMDMLDELNTNLKALVLTDPGLCIGTGSAAKVKIGNTTKYLHNGIFKSKSSAEVAFTATTHDITADADSIQEACYLVCLIADGTISLTMGAISSTDGGALLPEIPSGKTPIGYLRLQVAAGSTDFNASTDLLSAGHLTDTYVNLGFLSPRFDATQ